jgi:hypothetical protein
MHLTERVNAFLGAYRSMMSSMLAPEARRRNLFLSGPATVVVVYCASFPVSLYILACIMVWQKTAVGRSDILIKTCVFMPIRLSLRCN